MLVKSALDSLPVSTILSRRLRWMLLVVGIAFSLLIGRLWQLQILRGEEYYEAARENVVDEEFLPSVRGRVLDRAGRELATNRPAFNIYITPKEFGEGRLEALGDLLKLDEGELERMRSRYLTAQRRSPTTPMMVLEDQGRDRAALVAQARLELPGVTVRDEPWRFYPHGQLAGHLLGYMNHLTERELVELEGQGYDPSSMIGRYGLERQWEHYLRGKKGIERFVVNAKGERVETAGTEALIDGPPFVPPVPGHNIRLTIDLDVQRLAEQAVTQHAAAAVAVVDVATGRLLALVSRPTFDPNVMSGKLTRADEARMLADPRKPFLDKTLRHHYPPGSTYKFVAAVAALEDGVLDPATSEVCPGYHLQGRRTFRCTSEHERIDLVAAIQHSCNVYFWKLAERVGIDRMAEVAADFGFGAPTGIGMNGDLPGRVPTRSWYEQRETFKIGYTLNTAVGQGDVEVTVLQLAMAYAAIANGGKLYAPQVVRRVETPSGEVVADYPPVLRRKVQVSEETIDVMRIGMWKAVNEPGGTAYDFGRSTALEYAGKTGTAQVRSRRAQPDEVEGWHPHRDHAWFAGYAPADEPEIAVVVLVEHGGPGGRVAAPVARQIVEGYFGGRSEPGQPEEAAE